VPLGLVPGVEVVPPGLVELPGLVVLPGVVLFGLVLPGAPGVTEFGDPGAVLLGVVAPGLVVLGVVPGAVVSGLVVLPGVLCVAPGVVVPAVPGVVAVPPGAVVDPGVELCPAVPAPPAGAAPPAELCATTQLPQHKITDSNVTFVIDISIPSKNKKLVVRSLHYFLFEIQYRNLAPHKLSGLCLSF
jgi:hypothetical protein